MNPPFKKIAIIGLGLIGGSIAKSIKIKSQNVIVTGFDSNQDALNQAHEMGIVDNIGFAFSDDLSSSDLIILAVPVGILETILSEIKPFVTSNVITDVCSVKSYVIDSMKTVFGELPELFVPGHPLAGSEQSGIIASRSDLFDKRKVILTPQVETAHQAILDVTLFWQSLGVEVICMSPDKHDAILAATSHMPHLLAYSYIDSLAKYHDASDLLDYSAGGFKDLTRIAASDPALWRDILLNNSAAVLTVLNHFIADMENIRDLIEKKDSDELFKIFNQAKHLREQLS